MPITTIIAQLRTTNLAAALRFYTSQLGFALDFQYEDFYAGVRLGQNLIHLKQVDEIDPSIAYVDHGDHFHLYFQTDDVEELAERLRRAGLDFEREVHETPWATREFVIKDNEGHTLYFGQPLKP